MAGRVQAAGQVQTAGRVHACALRLGGQCFARPAATTLSAPTLGSLPESLSRTFLRSVATRTAASSTCTPIAPRCYATSLALTNTATSRTTTIASCAIWIRTTWCSPVPRRKTACWIRCPAFHVRCRRRQEGGCCTLQRSTALPAMCRGSKA